MELKEEKEIYPTFYNYCTTSDDTYISRMKRRLLPVNQGEYHVFFPLSRMIFFSRKLNKKK